MLSKYGSTSHNVLFPINQSIPPLIVDYEHLCSHQPEIFVIKRMFLHGEKDIFLSKLCNVFIKVATIMSCHDEYGPTLIFFL